MKREIFLNIEEDAMKGNVLDIGASNSGVIYDLYKKINGTSDVEYLEGKSEKKYIKSDMYDKCILFFSLSFFYLGFYKERMLRNISLYLKDGGHVFIWDIDKGYFKIFNSIIRVVLPSKEFRSLNVKNYNIFQNCSKEKSLKLVSKYFDIEDFKSFNGIYYIKGKKRVNKVESNIDSSKFKIHSHESSSEVPEAVHEGSSI